MNLIKHKLHLKKKSLEWLSRKTKISKRQLTRISNSKSNPLVKTAITIAKALDSTVEEVFIYPELED